MRFRSLCCTALLAGIALTASANPPNRAATDALVDELIAADRSARGQGIPGCPACTPPLQGAAQALEALGQTEDAPTQVWLQQARQFAEAYRARRGADFHPPARPLALRCEGAHDTMRRLAGLLPFAEKPAAFQQAMRTGYGDGAGAYTSYVRDLQVWPVQARCVKGQLDGPLEFWLFARDVRRYSDQLQVDTKLVYYRTRMQAGQAREGYHSITRTQTDILAGLDKQRRTLSRAADGEQLVYTEARPLALGGDGRSTELSFQVRAQASAPVEKAVVSFTVPLEGRTGFRTLYRGLQKSETSLMKNDVRHGLSQSWPFTEPLGPGLPDYSFPGSDSCYRDGEQIPMNPCRVEALPVETSAPSHYTLQDNTQLSLRGSRALALSARGQA